MDVTGSMYDPHGAHRSLPSIPSHSHHAVSISPAAAAAAAHLNHGAAAAAAAAAAMHHSAAAAAAAHSHSPYHSVGNHVSQVGANHMAAAAAAASVPDVHKRDKDAIYGSVIVFFFIKISVVF